MSGSALDSVTIVINNNGMGQADSELSQKLMTTYLNMLDLDYRLPENICFYAEGVLLTVTDSPVLEELRALEANGVNLIVCSTCLNFFDVEDELQVGTAGSMKDIVAAQWATVKVITL